MDVAILAIVKRTKKLPLRQVASEGASSEGVIHPEEEWIHHNPRFQFGRTAQPRPSRKLNLAVNFNDCHQCRSAPNVDPARSAPIVTSPYKHSGAEYQVLEPSIAGVTPSAPIFR